jgi:hypothetical protein
MTSQKSWTPLNQRTTETKDKVHELYKQIADKQEFVTSQDVYDKYKWGFLSDGLLYRGLTESKRKNKFLTSDEIRDLSGNYSREDESKRERDNGPGIEIDPDEPDEISQPLRWFRANAPNSKITKEAEDEFRIRLLQLYIAHVNRTGETYFPLLEEKLRNKADFYDN